MNPNLELEVHRTRVGLYTVTFGYKNAPLDVQEAAFAVHGLGMVSPAQLGFLRARQEGDDIRFNGHSRTCADVFYDDRNSRVVIVPDGAVSKLVGIAQLVNAHKQGKEYVIPMDQRALVYALVDGMLRKGTACTANHGRTEIAPSVFGQTELTSKLFSDERLGINAQEYGYWINGQRRKCQTLFFDEGDYVKSQKGPYLTRLRVVNPFLGFCAGGDSRILYTFSAAFGVRFEKTAERPKAKPENKIVYKN